MVFRWFILLYFMFVCLFVVIVVLLWISEMLFKPLYTLIARSVVVVHGHTNFNCSMSIIFCIQYCCGLGCGLD